MTQDKVIRSLVIVVLVLGAAVLAVLLLGWLTMAGIVAGGMMSGGVMGLGSPMAGAGLWAGLLAIVVLVGVVAALIWALRTPGQQVG